MYQGCAHCKFLHKYCFFGCHAHFSHIAASLYSKWLNTNWTSYGSLVAALSLSVRSACKISVISFSAGVPAVVCISLWHVQHFKSNQWNLESGWQNKRIIYCNVWSVRQYSPPPPHPKWILMNLYLEEESVSISDWSEIVLFLPNWTVILLIIDILIISSQSRTQSQTWNDPIIYLV